MTTPGPRVEPEEITPGLALFLDPDVLEQEGASYTCPPRNRVCGNHYFLVVQVVEHRDAAMMVPLYSSGSHRCRIKLDNSAMTGSSYWTGGTWHWDTRQVWLAPTKTIPLSAQIAEDRSTPTKRNRLHPAALPSAWRK